MVCSFCFVFFLNVSCFSFSSFVLFFALHGWWSPAWSALPLGSSALDQGGLSGASVVQGLTFLKDKRKCKGFSFVLSASLLGSESLESVVPPSDRHLRNKNRYLVRWGAQDPTSQPTVPSVLKGVRVPLQLMQSDSQPDGTRGSEGAKWWGSDAGHPWAEGEAGIFLLVLT